MEMATELQREKEINMGNMTIKNHFKRNRLYNVGILTPGSVLPFWNYCTVCI